jgi:hypothetical protein
MPTEPSSMTELFGEPIYTFTRAQALKDGYQVDVSATAREAGLKFPVFLTRTVWAKYVEVPPGVTCQDEKGRLWDVVWMLRHGIHTGPKDRSTILFKLHVRNDNRKAKLVTLKATVGPLDAYQPEPAITVMLPEED